MIKIAVIDTGIDEKYIYNIYKKINIKHFYIYKGKLCNGYKKITNFHGTCCCVEILKYNKNIEIVDINLQNDAEEMVMEDLVIVIEKLIQESVDIINISLGFSVYSKELEYICKKACDNNIAIVGAYDPTHVNIYPSTLPQVICVKTHTGKANEIKLINNKTISLSDETVNYIINNNRHKIGGTSLACARFSGNMSLLFDEKIYDKFKILNKHFKLNLTYNKNITQDFKDITMKYDIKNMGMVGVVILPIDEIEKVKKDLLKDNIVAYYDFKLKHFINVITNKPENNFDTIVIINSKFHEPNIIQDILSNDYKDKKIMYIKNENRCRNLKIYNTSKPVVLIGGFCHGVSKFEVQLNLYQNFQKDNIKSYEITFNPLGYIYGFDVHKYPSKLTFPNIVYDINQYINMIEKLNDVEIFNINIGGGILAINNNNINIFGKLIESYMYAIKVDVVILCIPCFIDFNIIKLYINNIYSHGVKEIAIVLSNKIIDASTLEDTKGLQTYVIDAEKYKYYLNTINNIKVYNLEAVKSNMLYKYILEKFLIN